jgi:hypothetical protein
MTDEPREALRRLEERLSQASETAERLIAEAARGARINRPPPAGYQAPAGDPSDSQAQRSAEMELLLAAVGVLRELVPPEALARLAAALREVLLAARALIDFYLERLERPQAPDERVRDIPID